MARKQNFKPIKELSVQEMARPSGQVFLCDSDEDMEKFLEAARLRAQKLKEESENGA